MVNATEYRAMAADHHRLAGMCRSPDSREQHLRLEKSLRALADSEEVRAWGECAGTREQSADRR
jgi:hypothetical protein